MRRRETILLLFAFLLPLLALSDASLWIDEANSALKAEQPSLAAWWHTLVSEGGSDLQMPLYMFYLWVWEKIAGHSELALRLANVPFFLLAQCALYRVARRNSANPIPLLLIVAINPFLWFYLNEARPYLMQYAAACLVVYALSEMCERRNFAWPFAIGILLLSGSSMLGMAWAASALAAGAVATVRARQWFFRKRDLVPCSLGMAGLAFLSAFYLWTMTQGARGSAAGQTGAGNILFILFELFGFAGLGPGRLDIREAGFISFQGYVLPVVLLALALWIVLFGSLRFLVQPANREKLIAAAIYGLGAAVFLVLVGLTTDFRLLGRHLTPLSPLVSIALAISLVRLWSTQWRIAAALVALLWLTSALMIRFAPRHRKDDYRSAAGAAREAITANKLVWWAADRAAACYYLPIEQSNPQFDFVLNPTSEDLRRLPRPDVVILSKPDLYDANNALAAFLAQENYRTARTLPAFTVWRR
ncbi:MAG: hypothetical protein ACXWFY_04530 [Chthoniobacterales bacterium]